MIKIRCVVERITYQNPENGYSVLKCAVKNYNDLVTVVGNLVDVNVGSVLLIDGNWKVDAKYGRQFLAESWEETMPATVFGIEKYLGSGLIKGVGPKVADCTLLFGFYKTDAFPKDVWVKRVLAQWYPNGLPSCVNGVEGIAQQYLFHYIRNTQK